MTVVKKPGTPKDKTMFDSDSGERRCAAARETTLPPQQVTPDDTGKPPCCGTEDHDLQNVTAKIGWNCRLPVGFQRGTTSEFQPTPKDHPGQDNEIGEISRPQPSRSRRNDVIENQGEGQGANHHPKQPAKD